VEGIVVSDPGPSSLAILALDNHSQVSGTNIPGSAHGEIDNSHGDKGCPQPATKRWTGQSWLKSRSWNFLERNVARQRSTGCGAASIVEGSSWKPRQTYLPAAVFFWRLSRMLRAIFLSPQVEGLQLLGFVYAPVGLLGILRRI